MLEKNKIYEAIICDYTAEGQGIAKIDGCVVFVPNAIAGETCRIRIEKAKSLIENSAYTIAEISDMTGFASQSYFSTAFKAYTGMTPSQYKKQKASS